MLTGVFLNDVTKAQKAAVGKLNSKDWYGGKRASWVCTGCISRPEIFGYSWRITANFSNNPRSWDAFERWIDPNTGHPPSDIQGDDVNFLVNYNMPDAEAQARKNGVTRARVNDLADFELLFGRE